jgi:hypothetical protein
MTGREAPLVSRTTLMCLAWNTELSCITAWRQAAAQSAARPPIFTLTRAIVFLEMSVLVAIATLQGAASGFGVKSSALAPGE